MKEHYAHAWDPPPGPLAAYDPLPVGILACDPSGRVLRINPHGVALLAHCAPQLAERRIHELFAPLETLRALADRPGAEGRVEAPALTGCAAADGPRMLAYRVVRGAPPAALLVVFRDVTAEHRLQTERDRLLRMALVGELLPSVLHELRNPLAAVTSTVENLVEESLDDAHLAPHQPALHAVLHEMRRMGLVFQGIGSVGRSLVASRPGAVDLAIEETCRIMQARAERHGVSLSARVDALPLLPFDLSVARALTFNLVNNAIEACHPGDAVAVSACLEGDRLRLVVRDTGEGMAPEVLAQCLEPFFTTRPNGSGLGLVICRETVEAAGGSLQLDSTPGLGTRAVVEVPIPAAPPRPAPPVRSAAPPVRSPAPGGRPRGASHPGD